MRLNARIIRRSADEQDVGMFAHFTHTPINTPLIADERERADWVRIAVQCFKLEHWSVFEFPTVLFRIDCPIFVARQLMRHRNGTFLEKSLRLLDPFPSHLLKEPADPYRQAYAESLQLYEKLRKGGAKKETARAVLTLNTPTSFLWNISLRSLFNVFNQRLHPSAQKETREIVKQMFNETYGVFPNVLDAWKESKPELKDAVEISFS